MLVSCVLKDRVFVLGIHIVITVHHISNVMPLFCYVLCRLCVRNWSGRYSTWQLFVIATVAVTMAMPAIVSVCLAFIINPIPCSIPMTIPIWMQIHIQHSRFQLYALFWHF